MLWRKITHNLCSTAALLIIPSLGQHVISDSWFYDSFTFFSNFLLTFPTNISTELLTLFRDLSHRERQDRVITRGWGWRHQTQQPRDDQRQAHRQHGGRQEAVLQLLEPASPLVTSLTRYVPGSLSFTHLHPLLSLFCWLLETSGHPI